MSLMIWYGVLGLIFFISLIGVCVSGIMLILFRIELHTVIKRKPKKKKNIAKWEKRLKPIRLKVNYMKYLFLASLASVITLFLILWVFTIQLQVTNQLPDLELRSEQQAEK